MKVWLLIFPKPEDRPFDPVILQLLPENFVYYSINGVV